MSDNNTNNVLPIFPEEEQPEKKSHKKQWIIFSCILAAVLIILFLILFFCTDAMGGLKRLLHYGNSEEKSSHFLFDSYGNSSYALAGDRFAVASQDGISLFSDDGTVLKKLTGSLSNPVIDSEKDLLLVSDVGGRRTVLMDKKGTVCFDLQMDGIIYDADLAENGTCAVLYEGSSCYAVLDVFNSNGDILYSHHSESAFLNTCALSPDGSVAVVTTLGQEDINFQSSGRILTTQEEGIRAVVPFGTQVIFDAAFLNAETICAVGENSLFFFDTQGNLISEYQAENAGLVSYTFDRDHIFAVYDLFEIGKGYRISSISAQGEVTSSVDVSFMPQDLHACGNYLSVLDTEHLTIYNQELKPCSETVNTGYAAARVRKDGTALCIGSGRAELYIP